MLSLEWKGYETDPGDLCKVGPGQVWMEQNATPLADTTDTISTKVR